MADSKPRVTVRRTPIIQTANPDRPTLRGVAYAPMSSGVPAVLPMVAGSVMVPGAATSTLIAGAGMSGIAPALVDPKLQAAVGKSARNVAFVAGGSFLIGLGILVLVWSQGKDHLIGGILGSVK